MEGEPLNHGFTKPQKTSPLFPKGKTGSWFCLRLGRIFFREIVVHVVQKLFFLFLETVQIEGLGALKTQEVVGGDVKKLCQGHEILGGGNGQAHLPGIDGRARDANFFGQGGL